MYKPTVKVIHDYNGEWAEMWVNGNLYRQGHSDYSEWYESLIEEHFGITIEHEEKCLDDSHFDCDCPEEIKEAAKAEIEEYLNENYSQD